MEILEIVIKLNIIIEFPTDILEILTDILEISNCCMYYKYAESFFFLTKNSLTFSFNCSKTAEGFVKSVQQFVGSAQLIVRLSNCHFSTDFYCAVECQ